MPADRDHQFPTHPLRAVACMYGFVNKNRNLKKKKKNFKNLATPGMAASGGDLAFGAGGGDLAFGGGSGSALLPDLTLPEVDFTPMIAALFDHCVNQARRMVARSPCGRGRGGGWG